MQYAFILGRVYTLSLAEVLTVLTSYETNRPASLAKLNIRIVSVSPEVLVIESDAPIDATGIQKTLGGCIKIIKIIESVPRKQTDSIYFTLQNYFQATKLKKDYLSGSGKIQFGISVYLLDLTTRAFGEPKKIGMLIKRAMQNIGSSIRLVLPEFNSLALASVVVTKNLLIEKGAEICAIVDVDKIYVGKTLVVQDFEDYGRRDYQRPFRDDKQGMIPPKVAQIMINLTGKKTGSVLLDPFCGMGTIVQEGVLLGHKVVGTDLERFNISSAEKNLEWFRNRYKLPKTRYHVETSDARNASKIIQNLLSIKSIHEVNGIVTEGTLGPIYTKFPKNEEIEKNFADLEDLYRETFKDMNNYLKTGASVVMCLPCYKKNANEYIRFKNLDFITSLGYHTESLIKPALAQNMPFLRLTSRGTAIYDRKDQIVAREIVNFIKD